MSSQLVDPPKLYLLSGLQYQYYFCPAGLNNCSGITLPIIEECNKYSEEYGGGAECALFSRNRTIKWNNGINKNFFKQSKIHILNMYNEINDKHFMQLQK